MPMSSSESIDICVLNATPTKGGSVTMTCWIFGHIFTNAQVLQFFWCYFKGCGMGTLFVLVSPCFRENVVVTCKIGSFLCSLDNLLQKNLIVFFFGNQISKWPSFEKRAIFELLFTFFSHQGKVTKIPMAHISVTCMYIHVFCSPYWLFLPYQFWKKYNGFSLVWVTGFDSYLRHFGTINK